MLKTTVIHIKDSPKDWKKRTVEFVYIGRLHWFGSTKFGNPFKLNEAGDNRGEVMEKFEEYARARLEVDPEWRHAVTALYGRTLVCHCKPEGCHGDILAKLAAELNPQQASPRQPADVYIDYCCPMCGLRYGGAGTPDEVFNMPCPRCKSEAEGNPWPNRFPPEPDVEDAD